MILRTVEASFVTIVCTEIIDSAMRYDRYDAQLDARRAEHFAALRQAIGDHGGREVKSIGDGLMVAFSSTVAAVRCAVDMQRATTGAPSGLPIRIGIDAGEPTADGVDFFGTPVIVARRLCEIARAGEVLATHVVRQIAGPRVAELMRLVGLDPLGMERYPHAFSGGQRQRIGIARALAISPEFIVADEPVSALDVSVRAQVVNLFQDLQRQLGLTYLFIAHDLAIVRHISHRIGIMYAGRIVEIGGRDTIYDAPRHPYTEALLSAVLEPDPKLTRGRPRQTAATEAPNVIDPTPGCSYHARCPLARDRCRRETPPLTPRGPDHLVACFER